MDIFFRYVVKIPDIYKALAFLAAASHKYVVEIYSIIGIYPVAAPEVHSVVYYLMGLSCLGEKGHVIIEKRIFKKESAACFFKYPVALLAYAVLMLQLLAAGDVVDGSQENGVIAFDKIHRSCTYAEPADGAVKSIAPYLTVKVGVVPDTLLRQTENALLVLFKKGNGNVFNIRGILFEGVAHIIEISFIKVQRPDLISANLKNTESVIHTVKERKVNVLTVVSGYDDGRVGYIGNFFIHGAAPSHIYSVNFTAFSIIPRQGPKINSYFKKTTYYLIAEPYFVS